MKPSRKKMKKRGETEHYEPFQNLYKQAIEYGFKHSDYYANLLVMDIDEYNITTINFCERTVCFCTTRSTGDMPLPVVQFEIERKDAALRFLINIRKNNFRF